MLIKIYYFIAALVLLSSVFIVLHYDWFLEKTDHYHIQSFNNYREIQPIFDTCDNHSLVIFDVDDTLITASDIMARDLDFDYELGFKVRAFLRYPSLILEKNQLWFASILFQQANRFVFDPDILPLIKKLQKKQCPIVAITSLETGSLGVINNMQEWRAQSLHNLGIDLSGQFPDTVFTQLPAYRGNYPVLYKGILYANQQNKGMVLGAFLDYCHMHPARIVYCEDQKDKLRNVAHECIQRKIPFAGYQSLEAENMPGEWNTKRALIQLDSIMKHALWLTDQEADALLAQKK